MIVFKCTICDQEHESPIQLPQAIFQISTIRSVVLECPKSGTKALYDENAFAWRSSAQIELLA